MRAINTLPGTADSARLEEIPEAPDAPDTLLVDAIAIGVCGTDLSGVPSGARFIPINLTALNKQMVLENNVVFGAVSANLRHYRAAVAALAQADRGWLQRLISRRVPRERWREALVRGPADVKPVIVFG